jgi:hypothetical protein
MKLELEQTSKIVQVELDPTHVDPSNPSVRARMWQGTTPDGIPAMALVLMVVPMIPATDPRQAQFENELLEVVNPVPTVERFSNRIVL